MATTAMIGKKKIHRSTLPNVPAFFCSSGSVRIVYTVFVFCSAASRAAEYPQFGQAAEKYLVPQCGQAKAFAPAFVPQEGQKPESNTAPQFAHLFENSGEPHPLHVAAESSFNMPQYLQTFILASDAWQCRS